MSQQTNWVPTSVDLEKPSGARVYDYLLGGNHNFGVDREFSEKVLTVQPHLRRAALMNRSFLRRAVIHMMDNGIRQFLDLGSGIPTVGNVHEIAHAADPSSRVVYVDNEHVAVAHSQLILEGNDNAAMLHADISKAGIVLGDPTTRRLIDFDQPVGLLAITIGHYIVEDALAVFDAYREALAPGSFLAITHLTDDFNETDGEELAEFMKKSQNNVTPRTKDEVTALFGDFELVEPGVVTTSQWRPERDTDVSGTPGEDVVWAGVARKN